VQYATGLGRLASLLYSSHPHFSSQDTKNRK